MSTSRAARIRRTTHSFFAATLVLAASSALAGPAIGGQCTRRHPRFPLELELGDLGVYSTLRADVDTDGTVDLLLLGSQPPRRLAITRVVFPPGGSLAAEFLAEGVAAADRVVYRALHDGDFDGDGQRDLVAVYQLESGHGPVRIELLLGLGAGRFDPARVTVLTGLRDVLTLVGDFDADGRSELAFPRQRMIRVFGHDRAAGWRELYQRALPFNFDEAVVADLDRDGADDLAVWSRDVATALGALLGSPAAPLADWWLTWVGTIVSPLAALDRRSADPPTILVGIGSPEWNPQLLGLRWDPPSVGFVPAWIVPRPPDATYWTPLELDGDGREDVAFELISGSTPWGPDPQPGDRGRGYQVLLSRADGPPELGERSGGLPRLLDTRDLDGDGVLDALLLPESSVGLVRYRGLPGARFAEPKRFGEALGDWPTSFFRADLDRDGTLDLLSYRRGYGHDRPRFQSLLGRGDGTFHRLDPVELIDDIDYLAVRDLDGDGAVDFVIGPRDDPAGVYTTATNVYYGRGDGTFEPHVPLPHLTGGRMWSYVGWDFGDLDGDGDDDMLVKIPTWGWSDVMAWPYFVDGRSGHYGPRGLERAGNSGYVYRLLDVDGDGRDDPTYFRSSDAPGPASTALVWRRITQAGDFEAERVLLEWDPSALALTFAARAELDAAEAGEELLFQLRGSENLLTMTLSGSATTGNRLLWSQQAPGPSADVLVDADADGTLDLVTYAGGLHVVPGDGRGGFLPRRMPLWYTEICAMLGDFTGDSHLDLLASFGLGSGFWSALTVDAGLVLEEDTAPPSVQVRLEPVIDRLAPPVGFENLWRATTLIEDECDARPEVRMRQIDWSPVPPDTVIRFRRAPDTELRLYERPGSGFQTLVLHGPTETEVRVLFDRLQQQGGAAIERVEVLRLVASDAYGALASDLGDGDLAGRRDRLVRRYAFHDGRLTGAAVTRPGGDLRLSARARDGAGREGGASVSLAETYQALCAQGGIPGCR